MGEVLAERLRGEGFAWVRSQLRLERRGAGRREQLRLVRLRSGRTVEQVGVDVVLNVRDGRLARWRRDHPDQTLRGDVEQDWLCGHPLGALTEQRSDGRVDLTDPTARRARIEELAAVVGTVALPWFASTRRAGETADRVPDVTLDRDLVNLTEWLVSRGERAQAARLVRRWLEAAAHRRSPYDEGRALAAEGRRPTAADGVGVLAGWTSAALDLPVPPPADGPAAPPPEGGGGLRGRGEPRARAPV